MRGFNFHISIFLFAYVCFEPLYLGSIPHFQLSMTSTTAGICKELIFRLRVQGWICAGIMCLHSHLVGQLPG